MIGRHQGLLQTHPRGQEGGQPQQDHHRDRGDVHRDDLEGEQEDREQ